MNRKHLWGNLFGKHKWIRRLLLALCAAITLLILLIAVCNAIVIGSAAKFRFTQEELKQQDERYDCILVLGAKVQDGRLSPILQDRMDVGLELFAAGYADMLLLSGDSASPDIYDETGTMAAYAIQTGVSDTQIITDGLGLSTYESVWRAKYVYHAKRILIVTQGFHLSRALFEAHALGLECAGVASDLRPYYFKNYVREALARVKAVPDALFQPTP